MTLVESIKRYIDNAEYERTHGNLQGCLEFKQLAEWLKELKDYRERMPSYEAGYNDAKREIALSGEYERAYERGKSDAEQTRWIPVSERLPEKTGRYLCTVGVSYRNPREMYYAPQEWANKSDNATWRSVNDSYVYDWLFVKAWMPLPEPYREIKHTCFECIIKDTDACSRGNTEAEEVACEDFVGGESDAK